MLITRGWVNLGGRWGEKLCSLTLGEYFSIRSDHQWCNWWPFISNFCTTEDPQTKKMWLLIIATKKAEFWHKTAPFSPDKFEYLSHYLLLFHTLISTVPTVTAAENRCCFQMLLRRIVITRIAHFKSTNILLNSQQTSLFFFACIANMPRCCILITLPSQHHCFLLPQHKVALYHSVSKRVSRKLLLI